MTTYIKKIPSDLEYTLQYIREMKEKQANEPSIKTAPHLSSINIII